MLSRDKKNFLISVVCSILIFIGSFLLGSYTFMFGKVYGLLAFFGSLVLGLMIFVMLMRKYRK